MYQGLSGYFATLHCVASSYGVAEKFRARIECKHARANHGKIFVHQAVPVAEQMEIMPKKARNILVIAATIGLVVVLPHKFPRERCTEITTKGIVVILL